MPNKKTKIERIYFVIFCIILSIFIWFGFKQFNLHIPCIFHKITGFYCPGCGLTRMIDALLHFQIYQAFRYNPLLFIYFPFIIFYLIDYIIKYIKGSNNYLINYIPKKIIIIVLIITILFGVLRNIDCFSFLIPKKI